ncbi:hypothetical protein D8Z77_21800 [Brevibacillus laterosporus]|nr:hypothetical protein D8Z77_21800 [Brevibacillus laterosporus]
MIEIGLVIALVMASGAWLKTRSWFLKKVYIRLYINHIISSFVKELKYVIVNGLLGIIQITILLKPRTDSLFLLINI